MTPARAAILRTLAWYETIGYVPTLAELLLTLDTSIPFTRDGVLRAYGELLASSEIRSVADRVGLAASVERLTASLHERDPLQPRKRRKARRIAAWLARFGGVRAVCLANTTALGYARDEGDLDFFIITKTGALWATRLFAAGPLRLLGMSPQEDEMRDAACLSYFISDKALDLSSQLLSGDDPYFRYWFLSLLPLYDDGVLQELWDKNEAIRARHPFARTWIAPPDIAVSRSRVRFPSGAVGESLFRLIQERWFPAAIRSRLNLDTTVIATDCVLKFHVTDNRERYRAIYEKRCAELSCST